jgi:hypothetical protein
MQKPHMDMLESTGGMGPHRAGLMALQMSESKDDPNGAAPH